VAEEISDPRFEISEKEVRHVVAEAARYAGEATAAARRACGAALAAGLRLLWLHRVMGVQHGGDRRSINVPNGTLNFEEACLEVGVPKRTAYRWMNACLVGAVKCGLAGSTEEALEVLPDPAEFGRWRDWEENLQGLSQGMSVNRLLVGTARAETDPARLDALMSAEEEGRARAVELLEAVEAGKYTLAQAVRALGSKEAYDKLRAEGAEKVRRDPVYLDLDGRSGVPTGLVPKALVTLRNGFEAWEDAPEAARRAVRDLWLDVVAVLPEDLRDGRGGRR
jgi:hypothetical protein